MLSKTHSVEIPNSGQEKAATLSGSSGVLNLHAITASEADIMVANPRRETAPMSLVKSSKNVNLNFESRVKKLYLPGFGPKATLRRENRDAQLALHYGSSIEVARNTIDHDLVDIISLHRNETDWRKLSKLVDVLGALHLDVAKMELVWRIVDSLPSLDYSLRQPNTDYRNLLMLIVSKCDLFIVHRALQNAKAQDMDWKAVDREGNTLVHIAAARGNSDILLTVRMSVPSACLGEKNRNGETPLHMIATNARYEERCIPLARALLRDLGEERVVDCRSLNLLGDGLLHTLVKSENTELMNMVLPRVTVQDISARDKAGESALMHAVRMGVPNTVALLLRKIELDEPVYDWGDVSTRFGDLLLAAVRNANHSVVAMLVERLPASQFSVQDKERNTPLEVAVERGKNTIVHCLAERLLDRSLRYDWTHLNRFGDGVLHTAVKRQDYAMVQSLLNIMPIESIWSLNEHGETAMSMAMRLKDRQIEELFLK